MIARLALRYLGIFAIVLLALSVGAYAFLAREYAALLQPALATPEGARAYAAALRNVVLTIAAFDVPLLVIFGFSAWLMARGALRPLIESQELERAFSADAAHALRSPLAVIAGVAQARRGESEGQDAQAYDTIARAALRAAAVVTDLLTLARSAREQGLRKEIIDLAAVVADAAADFGDAAAARGIELTCRPASVLVDADERRIREMTGNLLANAVRHARSSVQVRVYPSDGAACITVANDGEVVPPAERERIFERFYRGDAISEGTGLGLAIVRWIALAHGGSVRVRELAGGEGAEFCVRLPLLSG